MDEEEEAYVHQLEENLAKTNEGLQKAQSGLVSSALAGRNDNLIVYQLDLSKPKEDMERWLRGLVKAMDKEGNVFYDEPKDLDLKTLNEYGVQLVMSVLAPYLNTNTLLSRYSDDRIQEVLHDLGHELGDLIYENFDKMGMDTTYKRSRYPSLVLGILAMIESAYKRAYMGGERESLSTARVVTQNASLPAQSPMGYPEMNMNRRQKFKLLKPSTWG